MESKWYHNMGGFIVNDEMEIVRKACEEDLVETAGAIQKRIKKCMEGKTVACTICGTQTEMCGTMLCGNCWEVTVRLRGFLQSKAARDMTRAIIKAIGEEKRSKA